MRATLSVAAMAACVLVACGQPAAPAVSSATSAPPPQAEAPATPARPTPPVSQSELFARQVDTFYAWMQKMHPTSAAGRGYHEYDGVLPDMSEAALRGYIAELERWQAQFDQAVVAKLTRVQLVEREVILAEIRGELFDLRDLKLPWRNPMGYVWPLSVAGYIQRDYAPLADRAKGIIGICDGAGAHLAHAQTNLVKEMPRTWLQTALLQVNGMISFVQDDVVKEMKGLDDATKTALLESVGRCVNAMSEYRDFLTARLEHATDDFALGEELFLKMIADKEGLVIDLARLKEIGDADLARNVAAMDAAAKAIAKRKPVAKTVAKVVKEKPAADKVLATATEQGVAMRQFLIDKAIVSIPTEDVAEVRESPPFMRWNFAFLSSAGAFEKKALPSFYYISPPDPTWPKKVQRDYIASVHDLLFVTIHEVWPGHFLHSLHNKQVESKVLKTFCSYSMSEGWAHYTEEMMWNAGVGDGDPKVHVGQLLNALLRNVRYVSAIGLHTGGMTVDQSKQLFITKAFQDEGNATQQAVRGTFDAGYLNYTLGKLMIMKLHDDWKAKAGDAYSLKAFHDEFLSYGCAPVPVIRKFMLDDDSPAL